MDLNELQSRAKSCKLCSLYKTRQTTVFSKGNSSSKIMICGMCPGADENSLTNKSGEPFIGRAGKLLDDILEDSELTLNDVYITNVVKCFLTPGIRLNDEWIDSCLPYLIGQVAEIEPKVIIALGTDAGRALLNKPKLTSLSSMWNKLHRFTNNVSIVVTYHPSYFLRSGGRKHPYYNRIIEDIAYAKSLY